MNLKKDEINEVDEMDLDLIEKEAARKSKTKQQLDEQAIAKKRSITGASLLWFVYSIVIAFTSAIVTLVLTKNINFSSEADRPWIIAVGAVSLITLVLICVEMFMGARLNFGVQLTLITLSMIGFGFAVLSFGLKALVITVFERSANDSALTIMKILGVLFLPIAILGVIAILEHYNKIKIKLVYTLIIMIFISMLFIYFMSFFIMRNWISAVYPMLGFTLMMLYMAADWWIISKYNKAYEKTQTDDELVRKHIIKVSIYFGFKLAVDYIWAIMYLIKFITRSRK